jgi:hypothetical protein
MDWSFSKSSLKLFEWIKLEDLHFQFYFAKIDAIDVIKKRKMAQKIKRYSLILMGWLFFIFLLVLIFVPMVLFSDLNPISKINPIKNAHIRVGILIG